MYGAITVHGAHLSLPLLCLPPSPDCRHRPSLSPFSLLFIFLSIAGRRRRLAPVAPSATSQPAAVQRRLPERCPRRPAGKVPASAGEAARGGLPALCPRRPAGEVPVAANEAACSGLPEADCSGAARPACAVTVSHSQKGPLPPARHLQPTGPLLEWLLPSLPPSSGAPEQS